MTAKRIFGSGRGGEPARRALRASLAVLAFVASLAAGQAQAPAAGASKRGAGGTPPQGKSAAPTLTPLPEPARPSRSAGPYPVWLAGPDGPIMPPQGFAAMGTIFGAAGPISSGAGGRVCAAPLPPACARQADTYRGEAARKACEDVASKLVQETFAYRECLEGEASRAVRAANETIRLLKCRKPSLKDCP